MQIFVGTAREIKGRWVPIVSCVGKDGAEHFASEFAGTFATEAKAQVSAGKLADLAEKRLRNALRRIGLVEATERE